MLEREELPTCVAGMFYQVVAAFILLYGNEIWVLSLSVLKEHEGFHMEVTRRLTGMRPHKAKGERVYSHSVDALAVAYLQPIDN